MPPVYCAICRWMNSPWAFRPLAPTPNSLMTRSFSSRKLPKTTTMIAAAAVMTFAVAARPSATEVRLSPVRSHSSRTRDSRNTS